MLSENARTRWVKDFENGVSLSFAPDSVKDNKELVMAAVSLNGMNLKFASERLQNDIDVVEAAVIQNLLALQFANKDLQRQIVFFGVKAVRTVENVLDEDTLEEEKKIQKTK